MKKLKYLIFLTTIFLNCECGRECDSNYKFEIPLQITPINSTLHVGDTLHVMMKTNNHALKELWANRIVNFPGFDPSAIFNLPRIDSLPVGEGFLLNRALIDTTLYGDAFIGHTEHLGLGLFFLEIPKDEDQSTLEFRVVLKTPGTYMLVCRDGIFFRDRSKRYEFPDRCENDGPLEVQYAFQQGNHEGILNENHHKVLDQYWKNSEWDFEESDKYYFKVVE